MRGISIEERAVNLAHYIIDSKDTVRGAAKKFGISKSTVHKDVSERLCRINPVLASEVRAILEENKAERHIRGGMATKLQDLTPWELEDFYNYLITDNSKSDGSEPLSATTIKHIHRTISKALNDGIRRGLLYYNVASTAKTPKAEKHKGEFLNQEQVQKLLTLFKGSTVEIPVVLCALFGFRRGEVLGLKWNSIDMIKRTITVSETLQQHIGGSITVPPKTWC